MKGQHSTNREQRIIKVLSDIALMSGLTIAISADNQTLIPAFVREGSALATDVALSIAEHYQNGAVEKVDSLLNTYEESGLSEKAQEAKQMVERLMSGVHMADIAKGAFAMPPSNTVH